VGVTETLDFGWSVIVMVVVVILVVVVDDSAQARGSKRFAAYCLLNLNLAANILCTIFHY